MSAAVNKVLLIGHVGADPEVRNLPAGGKVVSLRMAMTDTWRDKATGEKRERTEWATVVIFNEGLGKVAEQYVRKGSKLYVEGSLQTRKWQDQSGADRYSTEVVLQPFNGTLVLLGEPQGERRQERQEPPQPRYSADKTKRPAVQPQFDGGVDDDIPF